MAEEDKSRDAEILTQVEFYFSDSNFPKDKFLKAQAALNPDGNVPIATINGFKNMKKIGGSNEDCARVLRTSKSLEVTEDGKYVRRTDPLPENDVTLPRSIYAKGIPKDRDDLDTVKSFFEEHAPVLSVRLRRIPTNKEFKGSAFVEFKTAEEAEAVAKKELKFEGAEEPLVLKMKQAYFKAKNDERKEKIAAKKAENKDAKPDKNDSDAAKPDADADADANGEPEADEAEDEDEAFEPARILQVTNIGDDVSREDIKEQLGDLSVGFVDFNRGSHSGYVRFENDGDAQKAVEQWTEKKVELGGKAIEFSVLAGEEEQAYWKVIKDAQKDKKKGGKGKGKRPI